MPRRQPKAPRNLRNGLSWRDGRPRWEPSPASRRAGLKGKDLKDAAGAWLSHGAAIDVAEARALWAELIRDAGHDGPAGDEARADLARALEALPAMHDAADRQRRVLVDDLVEAARGRLGRLHIRTAAAAAPRTVAAMVAGYLDSYDAGELEISAASASSYRSGSKRLIAKFGGLTAGEITTGMMRDWYVEMKKTDSLATANLSVGAAGAFFRWATWKDWLAVSPCQKLGRTAAPGRRIIWDVAEEQAFIPWCDANGFEDVADAAILGLWTGARPFDMCLATLEDLAQATWRFVPHKGKRRGREALPGVLGPVRARLDRRAAAAKGDVVRHLNATPFLWDFRTHRRHDTDSLGRRYREARTAAVLADAVPAGFQAKRMQDTRDTCVTRLYGADVSLQRIPGWTGHSPDDRDEILRDHYLYLREQDALEDAAKLETWARKQGLML